MHIIQALKMACKSLWSNKMRSFLTMLGIIIGVVTVALLTSVASGVSNAVVSSVRTQSTLGVFMNMDKEITFSKANSIISNIQTDIDKESEEYFEYALALSASSVISAANIAGEISENVDESNFFFDPAYTLPENYNELPADQKYIADMLLKMKPRSEAMKTSISAVTKNYAEVYDLKIDGKFPTQTDEIVVDEEFAKFYFDGQSLENIIGEEITLGVSVKTDIAIAFSEAQTAESVEKIVAKLSTISFLKNMQTPAVSSDSKTVTIRVDYFRNLDNESAKTTFEQVFGVTDSADEPSLEIDSVELSDFYDMTNAKAFKIVGTLSDAENSSMFSSMGSTSETTNSSNELNQMTLMMAGSSSKEGSIYMLADNENKAVLGFGSDESIDNATLSSAYLRFKTESVMDSVINRIAVAFATPPNNFIIMQDFMLISMSSVASIISTIMGIMTTMLTVISVISLIVGGIGIMNIMLVAVTERTREIGIRKAIGAKKSAILVQFLVEALMLSLIGGLIGLGLSALGCMLIGNAMGIVITMPFWVIAMSLGFCTAIGLAFGMFPAIKASKMQPIDALRRD